MKGSSVREILKEAKLCLKQKDIETYSLDSELLLMHITGFTKLQLFTKDDYILTDIEKEEYIKLLEKRAMYEPVQYLIGRCEFMSLEFITNKFTLIPRADTEVLVETAIKYINKNEYKKILDIGTGSGAIAISIAKYCDDVNVTAVDISEGALNTAIINARNNGVLDKVNFIKSNIFDKVIGKYDVIVSNPPYIETDIIQTLHSQVKDYEPHSALDGGDDGLFFYRKIISNAVKYLEDCGMIFLEIGYNQAEAVMELLKENKFKEVTLLKDLSGHNRTVFGKYILT